MASILEPSAESTGASRSLPGAFDLVPEENNASAEPTLIHQDTSTPVGGQNASPILAGNEPAQITSSSSTPGAGPSNTAYDGGNMLRNRFAARGNTAVDSDNSDEAGASSSGSSSWTSLSVQHNLTTLPPHHRLRPRRPLTIIQIQMEKRQLMSNLGRTILTVTWAIRRLRLLQSLSLVSLRLATKRPLLHMLLQRMRMLNRRLMSHNAEYASQARKIRMNSAHLFDHVVVLERSVCVSLILSRTPSPHFG